MVYKEDITDIRSKGVTPTYINITEEVKAIVARSGIKDGVVHVVSPHTTCSVFRMSGLYMKTMKTRMYIPE